jgi:hypothetical protein
LPGYRDEAATEGQVEGAGEGQPVDADELVVARSRLGAEDLQLEQGSHIEGGVAIVEVDDGRAVAWAVGVVEMDVAAETAGAVDRVQEGERAGRRGGDQAVVGEGAADPSVAGIAQGFAGARYGAVDESLAIDGKTMCNAINDSGRQTHIISAVGHDSKQCYTQKKLARCP